MKLSRRNDGGFTLVETAVASAVVAIILGSIAIGGVSLQKILAGSDASLKATADQSRILDYIVRDVRQAMVTTGVPVVSNSGPLIGQMLTLTVPSYLDQNGNPVIAHVTAGSPTGTANYGSTTVKYFPANAPIPPSTTYTYQANGAYLIRQVGPDGGVGTTQTVISLDCTSLQINFTLSPSAATPTSVQASISFAPRFNFSNSANDRTGTTMYATATFRNPLN
jgi:type II secretory pathway component PulJ